MTKTKQFGSMQHAECLSCFMFLHLVALGFPQAAWKAPPLKATSGTLYKYIKNVTSASEGCVTDA
jgi:hypothetical protein